MYAYRRKQNLTKNKLWLNNNKRKKESKNDNLNKIIALDLYIYIYSCIGSSSAFSIGVDPSIYCIVL